MSEWISVKDRLPEKTGLYLIYEQKYNPMMETCFYSNCSGWQYGFSDSDAELITHWMPLPEPPEIEDEDDE